MSTKVLFLMALACLCASIALFAARWLRFRSWVEVQAHVAQVAAGTGDFDKVTLAYVTGGQRMQAVCQLPVELDFAQHQGQAVAALHHPVQRQRVHVKGTASIENTLAFFALGMGGLLGLFACTIWVMQRWAA